MSKKEGWIGDAFVGIGLAGMGFFGALAAASAVLGPLSIPIWGIAMLMIAVLVRSPVGKAFGERLAGRADDAMEGVPAELYTELDDLKARIVEMEERQDFTERLLAQSGEPKQLGR